MDGDKKEAETLRHKSDKLQKDRDIFEKNGQ